MTLSGKITGSVIFILDNITIYAYSYVYGKDNVARSIGDGG